MAEPQEKRIDDTNFGNNTQQDNSQTNTTNNQNVSSSANQIVSKVENALGVEAGKTKDVLQQAKETAGQAFGKVSEKATTQIDEQKVTLARGLSSVADNIRQMGENLRTGDEETPITNITAKYGDSLAKQVEQVSDYLENKDLRDVLKDVENFARRNPAVFLGGAFALGLLAARFLKSSSRNVSSSSQTSSGSSHTLKDDSEFADEGLHLPDDLEHQSKDTGNQQFKSGDSNTGNQTSTGSGTTNF